MKARIICSASYHASLLDGLQKAIGPDCAARPDYILMAQPIVLKTIHCRDKFLRETAGVLIYYLPLSYINVQVARKGQT
jgi:hypothetical protein